MISQHVGLPHRRPRIESKRTATFGRVTVIVSDAYFMVEPAEAVIVSANSHLRTATGGAHEVTRVAGSRYAAACGELLQGPPDGLPQGSAWLTGESGEDERLTTNQLLFTARSAPPPISIDCRFGGFGGTSEKNQPLYKHNQPFFDGCVDARSRLSAAPLSSDSLVSEAPSDSNREPAD